jgi:thymidylate synthase (FAD)
MDLSQITYSAFQTYTNLLNDGVCPEQARMVLPQNTMTTWIWSGTLGAFCDMLRLRLKEDTQEETREVANLISKEVERLFPVSYRALMENV